MDTMKEFVESIDEIASDVFSQNNKMDILKDKTEFIDLICEKRNYLQRRWRELQNKYNDHPRLQKINAKQFRAWQSSKYTDEHKKYVKEQFNLHMTLYKKKIEIQNTEIVKSDKQDIDLNKKIQDLEKENAKLQNQYDIEKKAKDKLTKINLELKEELSNSKDTEIQNLKELREKDNEINILKSQLNK